MTRLQTDYVWFAELENGESMENEVAAALLALAASSSGRKKISLIRCLLPQIQTAKAAGVTDEKIVGALKNQGIDISLSTYKSILYRLRKERHPIAGSHIDKGVGGRAFITSKSARSDLVETSRGHDTGSTDGSTPPSVVKSPAEMEAKANQYIGNSIADYNINEILKEDPK